MNDEAENEEATTSVRSSPTAETVSVKEVLELDHVFSALEDPRRRYICYTLLEKSEWSVTDLAMKLAAWENNCPENAVSDEDHERMYVSLYHAHIPKLVEEDVVTFDETNETIRTGENAAQVLRALEGVGATLDTDQEAHARNESDDTS